MSCCAIWSWHLLGGKKTKWVFQLGAVEENLEKEIHKMSSLDSQNQRKSKTMQTKSRKKPALFLSTINFHMAPIAHACSEPSSPRKPTPKSRWSISFSPSFPLRRINRESFCFPFLFPLLFRREGNRGMCRPPLFFPEKGGRGDVGWGVWSPAINHKHTTRHHQEREEGHSGVNVCGEGERERGHSSPYVWARPKGMEIAISDLNMGIVILTYVPIHWHAVGVQCSNFRTFLKKNHLGRA